ncbi:Bifunctional lycopene cyclase/phytoene synthase [Diplodia seriata]|uniref:Bifunctional lycopene cyclase/phytoene synthase n=1 Tax=Diplodia seriata TaxID=420778 RepID=A0A1S8BN64_9PEZI|nr:Bifunctional lycopene cyclase/phytoene synthase [Diplodia seriata]
MGYDYALVHLKYTIPPAVALTFLYRPLLTRLDVYKILFLVTIAVASSIPWDSYLIRAGIWTYPANAFVGPTLLDIPAEEVFFFVIQTYTTSLLYLLFSKPVFFPIYLQTEKAPAGKTSCWKRYQRAGQAVLALGIGLGVRAVKAGGRGTYMGWITLWLFPFLLLLWSLAYQLILGIPRSSSLWPIAVPTVYLWIVDTLALRRGTWVIETGTKLGFYLWPGLEIEYSFCRVADDLIDNAADCREAREWIRKLRMFLDLSYKNVEEKALLRDHIEFKFPPEAHSALRFLPTSYLSSKPLYDMLDGFEMDLAFASASGEPSRYPIQTVSDLDLYGERVAGTVAHSMLELVFHNLPSNASRDAKQRLVNAGARMGVALQYVNISRDIAVDARIQRVYIPMDWMAEKQLTPAAVIQAPQGPQVEELRLRLLDRAFSIYADAKGAIEQLPDEARGPMRVAVESYMEIGRVIREEGYRVREGRATVPKRRRILVAWKALRKSTA